MLALLTALHVGLAPMIVPPPLCQLGNCTIAGPFTLSTGDLTLTTGNLILPDAGYLRIGANDATGVRCYKGAGPSFKCRTGNDGGPITAEFGILSLSANSIQMGGGDTVISRASQGDVAITSTGKGETTQIHHNTVSVTFAGGGGDASKTTSGLVPDGAFLLGITTRVTTTATTCTSVDIGDGTDVDMFGDNRGVTQNTTTTNADATAQFGRAPATAAMEVTITGVGGNCVSGVWAITAHYILPTAATSN